MSHKHDIERLIDEYGRRLQKLKEQKARYGIATEPHILVEIEDIEAKLAELQAERVAHADLPRLNPYRGLAAFLEEDKELFFGREQFTAQLVASVRQKSLVALLGPSGSGKSSVIFAGLVPRLREDGDWLIAHFRPGHDPFRNLAGVLLPLYETGLDKTDQMAKVPKLATYLRENDLSLSDVVDNIFQTHLQAQHLLLIADQFEELYTLCPGQNCRQQFLDRLIEALPLTPDPPPTQPLHVILTLRADFLGQALLYPPFGDALQGEIELLRPMSPDEMRRAIEKPAAMQGVSFEAGLVERILAAVSNEPGKLPLLEFALTALWNQQVGEELTHAVYDAVGQVEGALSKYAEQVYNEELNSAEQQRARRIFVQMVRPGNGTENTRRLARREEVTGEADWELVQKLATARLVVTDRDPAGQETAEIIHEALIQGWGQLQYWMGEDRTFRLWQDRLRFALNQWQTTGQDEGALLRGVPLAEAEKWLAERETDLSPLDRKFIQASIDLREKNEAQKQAQHQRELEQQRALTQEQRKRAKVLAVASIVAVILAIVAVVFGVQSQRKAVEAQSLALASGAQRALSDNNTDLAIALALEANNIEQPPPLARIALAAAAYYVPGTKKRFVGHTDKVTSIAFNPKDGRIAVSGSVDDSLILWDLESGKNDPIIRRLVGHTGDVNSVAFSPNGDKILSGSSDNNLILWETESGQLLHRFVGHSQQVNSVAFSPDGRTILSGSNDGNIIAWDVISGEEIYRNACSAEVSSVEFSSDGRRFAAGTQDDAVCVWNAETGQQTRFIRPATYLGVTSLTFTPDNSKILVGAGAYGPGIFLWDIDTGSFVGSLSGHIGGNTQVALNSDGRFAATGAYDNQVILWNFDIYKIKNEPEKAEIYRLSGHTDDVTDIAFSPDGATILSGSKDKTLRLWDISSGAEIRHFTGYVGFALSPDGSKIASSQDNLHPVFLDSDTGQIHHFEGDTDQLISLTFSPDGRTIFSGDAAGNIHLWDVEHETLGKSFKVHPNEVTSIAVSPDGRYALSGSYGPPNWPGYEQRDDLLILWRVDTGQIIHRFVGHNRIVRCVAISPDGRLVLSGSDDTSVRLWDTQSGKMLRKFAGHTDQVLSVAFGPQGKTVLSASADQTIRLWDIETGREIRRFAGHMMGVKSIALSPDRRIFVSGSDDGSIRLWDIETGLEVARVTLSQNVWNVAFGSDGLTIWSRSKSDNTIRLLKFDPPDNLIQWTCNNRYVRELTCTERLQYGVEPFCNEDGVPPVSGICQSVSAVAATE